MKGRTRSGYGTIIMRRRALAYVIGFVLSVALVVFIAWGYSAYQKRTTGGDASQAMKSWNAQNYADVYSVSSENLKRHPLSAYWLVMNGMSSYQLAVAQVNREKKIFFIDSSIDSLRKAIMIGAGAMDSRARYCLGRAYFHKGPEFADLAVSYLEQAQRAGYSAQDLAEYLGLAYASLREYRESVAAFSLALGDNPSELLLLAIARSYIELDEMEQAKAYLVRCIESSHDVLVSAQAHLLLGALLKKGGDLAGAEREYLASAEADDKNADAFFSLGELYAESGDTVRARAEWRKAIRINPNHGPARTRLGM